MLQCKPARSILTISELPNYNSQSPDHILFLHFRMTGKPGGKERVELVSAKAATGRVKELGHPVTFPIYIMAIPRYNNDPAERAMYFENPLLRAVELSDPDGNIRRQEVRETQGYLFLRMQIDPGLNDLELFSVSPDKGAVKIYILHFKQP